MLSVVERYLLLLEDKFYMLGIKFLWRSNLMSQSKGEQFEPTLRFYAFVVSHIINFIYRLFQIPSLYALGGVQ